jgi:hypothetical protein
VRTTRGSHDLYVDADGYTPLDRPVLVAAERAPNVDVTLAARGVSIGTTTTGGRKTLGLFLAGGGAVAAAVGIFAGIEALTLAHAYNTPDSGSYQDQGTKSRGITFRTSADVAFVGALVLGGAGAYFLLTAPSSKAPQARVVLGPGFGAIAGSF